MLCTGSRPGLVADPEVNQTDSVVDELTSGAKSIHLQVIRPLVTALPGPEKSKV